MSLTANSPHHNLLLITDFCVSEALKSLAAQQSSVLHANCDVTTCQNALSMLSSQAYQAILGFTPRLLLASFLAYLVGEFLNSFVLARLKVRTQGRYLWLRTISSTIIGQGADSLIFISVAFWGILPPAALTTAILSQWLVKVVFEILATPLTYLLVNALKRSEGVDVFDRETNFNPVAF